MKESTKEYAFTDLVTSSFALIPLNHQALGESKDPNQTLGGSRALPTEGTGVPRC